MEREPKGIVQGAQPYLRSGKGTESRQQASQSSRRYIPKGGFVIDFTTQPLPKGKGRVLPNGCHVDIPREVLIVRQQRAAARLSAPKQSANSSPVSKKPQLSELDLPDHPKPWGAPSSRVALKEAAGPCLSALSGTVKQAGYNAKMSVQARTTSQIEKRKAFKAGSSCASQRAGDTLDDEDIFDDDAPLLATVHISKAPTAASKLGVQDSTVCKDSFQAGVGGEARHAPVTSLYVQQLLSHDMPGPESAGQRGLLDLKAQIAQAAAALELEKQAFQRSRAEDETAWREVTRREERRLQREKAILSRQSQVLLKLPSKREKAEVEALSAALAEERRVGRAMEARHKLTVQRVQRHVTQLQGRVAELEDEVRWHAQHKVNAAQLPSSIRQLQCASSAPQKPERNLANKLPPETNVHHRVATAADTKHDRAVDSSDYQQPMQVHFSRPATPEHPEQQLSTLGPPSNMSSAAALAVPGSHQAIPALGDAVAHGSRSKAGSKHAGASEEDWSSIQNKAANIQIASELGRHQNASHGPPAVSWQVDIDRSGKPAHARQAPPGGQSPTRTCPTLPKQPGSDRGEGSLWNRSHGGLADAKHDGSRPARHHAMVQSALQPSQLPEARLLPPLPDFMSLETLRLPSYSQDMPRMQALYAATDLASAFPHKPLQPAEAPHSAETQAVEVRPGGMLSPSSVGTAPLGPEMIQPVQEESLAGAQAASKGKEYKTHQSKQHEAQLILTPAECPDGLQQTLGAPLPTALHKAGTISEPNSAATGMWIPPHSSTGAVQGESKRTFWVSDGSRLPRMRAPHVAAGGSHTSAAGAPSGFGEPGKPGHEFGHSGCTASSSDEYASIKASLRCLQELLNKPKSPVRISNDTECTATGSSLDRAGASGGYQHGTERDAAATAPSEEQSESQPITDAPLTIRVAPKLSQDAHDAPRSASQQEGQLNGCIIGDLHTEAAQLPDTGQGLADDFERGLSSHHKQQDMGSAGAGGTGSCHAATLSDGTCRRQSDDGHIIVRFKNGDCKRSCTDGTVEYYYAKADTWHTTCPGGIEVYHFPSGQTEAHHPGGLKEIIFQDGSVRLVDGKGADIDAELDHLSVAARRRRPSLPSIGNVS